MIEEQRDIIVFGSGRLLTDAVSYVTKLKKYMCVAVVPPDDTGIFKLRRMGVRVICSEHLSKTLIELFSAAPGSIGFSVNNRQVVDDAALTMGVRVYNIHGALSQEWRGLGELCITGAIAYGSKEFGVTLQRMEPGAPVDGGYILDQIIFDLGNEDIAEKLFDQVMRSCRIIFERNFQTIVSESYEKKQLQELGTNLNFVSTGHIIRNSDKMRVARALDFGRFSHALPNVKKLTQYFNREGS